MRFLRRVADGLARLSAALAALALLFTTGTVLVDVVGRAFGHPLYGAQDLVGMAAVVLVFGAMAEVGRSGGHIAVDLFAARFPEALNRTLDLVIALFGAAIFAALAWTTFESAQLSRLLNLSTNLLYLPKAWFQYAVVLFCAICSLGLLVRAADPAGAGGRRDPEGGE